MWQSLARFVAESTASSPMHTFTTGGFLPLYTFILTYCMHTFTMGGFLPLFTLILISDIHTFITGVLCSSLMPYFDYMLLSEMVILKIIENILLCPVESHILCRSPPMRGQLDSYPFQFSSFPSSGKYLTYLKMSPTCAGDSQYL